MLQAVEDANDAQKQVLVQKIVKPLRRTTWPAGASPCGDLAFKPNTDDMREASARVLIG